MSTPVLVLTPNLYGSDGISRLARLVTGSFDDAAVLALHESVGTSRFGDATVQGAGGNRWRFVTSAFQTAISANPRTRVIVTHLHLAPAALPFMLRGIPVTTMLCGVEAWRRLSRLREVALGRAAQLIAISQFTRAGFLKANPHFADRPVDVCHLGVGPLPGDDRTPVEPPTALIVGRMARDERYKGHDLLLEIWREVVAAVPDAALRIVGDGDDRVRLEGKAASLALGDRVLFLGRLDDEALQREYERCTAFVMPSRNEGFGFVFVEAMRAARACVGSPGAAAEIIADGETGLLVAPDDRTRLLETVVQVLRDRPATAAMGARGRARFLQQFTEERFRDRFAALLPTAS